VRPEQIELLPRGRRLEQIYRALKADGWQVAVTDLGTNVPTAFGVPLPSAQPVTFLLSRPAGGYTARDAEDAVRRALAMVREERSAVTAWLGELGSEVAAPTVRTATAGALVGGTLGAAALGVVALLYATRGGARR
jgi:hypothetical protein